jgi:hypothetical protein
MANNAVSNHSTHPNHHPSNPFANISEHDLLHIPGIRCPITGEVMQDPKLLVANGVSYEGTAITAHLRANGTNPETGEPLNSSQRRLLPNPALKELITAIRARIGAYSTTA